MHIQLHYAVVLVIGLKVVWCGGGGVRGGSDFRFVVLDINIHIYIYIYIEREIHLFSARGPGRGVPPGVRRGSYGGDHYIISYHIISYHIISDHVYIYIYTHIHTYICIYIYIYTLYYV